MQNGRVQLISRAMKTELVAQLQAYLEGALTLAELVDWAEGLVMEGFEASPIEVEIIYRLGVADAENFELLHENVLGLLTQLENWEWSRFSLAMAMRGMENEAEVGYDAAKIASLTQEQCNDSE